MNGNIESVYRLTPTQDGILFHVLSNPDSGIYFEQLTVRLKGELNAEIFEQAWHDVVHRHQALRTFFTWKKRDRPLQIVRSRVTIPVTKLDWSSSPSELVSGKLDLLLDEDRAKGFTLDTAPLLRLTLIRLSSLEHLLVWSFHHLSLDGWSVILVLNRVLRNYASLFAGHTPEIQPERPFETYVAWLEEQDSSRYEGFWKALFKDFDRSNQLSLSGAIRGPSSKGPSRLPKTKRIVFDQQFSDTLADMARRRGLTLASVVHGIWALTLNLYTNDNDVVFGTTMSGRSCGISGIEEMVGLLINTLPVRLRIKTEVSMTDWFKSVQALLVELREHEHTPLTNAKRWSGVPADCELFESIVVIENTPDEEKENGKPSGLMVTDLNFVEWSHYPIAILALPGPCLEVMLVHDLDRCCPETAQMMVDQIERLLRLWVAHPDADLLSLPVVTPSKLCGPTLTYDTDRTVLDVFSEMAVKNPEHPAVVSGKNHLSYAELDRRASSLAHELRRRGLTSGSRVGIAASRTLETVVAIIAALKAGAAYVPLDPEQTRSRIRHVLEDAAITTILASRSGQQLREVGSSYQTIWVEDDVRQLNDPPDFGATLNAAESDEAYVLYTSGTSGAPKGVVVSHKNLMHSTSARFDFYECRPKRFLLLPSFAFDSSVAGLFWTLCSGGTLSIAPEDIELDAHGLAELIHRSRITHTLTLPSLYRSLLELADPALLMSLEVVIVAGEACSPDLPARHHRLLPRTKLFNEYGPTEATVWCTAGELLATDNVSPVPIGRAIANTEIRLVDENLRPVPRGVIGELVIAGDGVSAGYLNQDAITQKTFLPGLPGAGDSSKFYRTGDLARLRRDGRLEFRGRRDTQVKIRGHRVELEDIEHALRQNRSIADAAAVLTTNPSSPAAKTDQDALLSALERLAPSEADELLDRVEDPSPTTTEGFPNP